MFRLVQGQGELFVTEKKAWAKFCKRTRSRHRSVTECSRQWDVPEHWSKDILHSQEKKQNKTNLYRPPNKSVFFFLNHCVHIFLPAGIPMVKGQSCQAPPLYLILPSHPPHIQPLSLYLWHCWHCKHRFQCAATPREGLDKKNSRGWCYTATETSRLSQRAARDRRVWLTMEGDGVDWITPVKAK